MKLIRALVFALLSCAGVALARAIGPTKRISECMPVIPPELYAALAHKSGREYDLPSNYHLRLQCINVTVPAILPGLESDLPLDNTTKAAWHTFGRYRNRVLDMDRAGSGAQVPPVVRESLRNATDLMVHFMAVMDSMRQNHTFHRAVMVDIWRRMMTACEHFVVVARQYFKYD